jgi:hypothetical protein
MWGSNCGLLLFWRRLSSVMLSLFMSTGWDYVSELWSPTHLLFIPQVICECGESQWNDTDGKYRRTRRKPCPNAILSDRSPTWTDLGMNPCLPGKRLVTNCLSHGMAFFVFALRSLIEIDQHFRGAYCRHHPRRQSYPYLLVWES